MITGLEQPLTEADEYQREQAKKVDAAMDIARDALAMASLSDPTSGSHVPNKAREWLCKKHPGIGGYAISQSLQLALEEQGEKNRQTYSVTH